jgi:diguanylate cyclase (GGDEF)-like protein
MTPISSSSVARRGLSGQRDLPLWTKLIALVVVPLLATGTVAFWLTSDRLARSSASGAIVKEAELTGAAQVLQSRVNIEGEVVYGGRALVGVFRQIPIVGTIMQGEAKSAVASTNQAVATISTEDQGNEALAQVGRQLLSARKLAAGTDVAPAQILAAYMVVVNHLEQIVDGSFATMATRAAGLTGGGGLVRDIQSLQAGQQLQIQVSLFGTQIVQFLGAKPSQRSEIDGEIVSTTALIRSDSNQLDSLQAMSPNDDLQSLSNDNVSTLLATAHTLLDTPLDAPVSLSLISDLAGSSGGMTSSSNTARNAVVNGIVRTAEDLRTTAVHTAEGTALVLALLILVTCGLCYRLYRAIHIPLDALAQRAYQITQGQLEIGDEHGTREIAAVGRALNEAILNLSQLKTQAEALAEGDLEHPSLGQATPGRLGQSFYQSVVRVADLQQQLQYQASHDPLTGLLNRRAAIDLLDEALEVAGGGQQLVGVMFIDLDGFKQVNDTNGHNVGDHVLRVTASRLTSLVDPSDIVCRLGGDEFIVIVTDAGDLTTLQHLGRRMVKAIEAPISAGPTIQVQVGASVGVSISNPQVVYSGDELIAEADIAVYKAKDRGRGRVPGYRGAPPADPADAGSATLMPSQV